MFSPDEFNAAHLTPEDLGYDLSEMMASVDPAILAGMRSDMDQVGAAIRDGDLELAAKLQVDGDLKRLAPLYRNDPEFDLFGAILAGMAFSPKAQLLATVAEAMSRLARLEAQK